MGKLIHFESRRRKKPLPEQILEPEDLRDRELGNNVIRLVRKIDKETGGGDGAA